MSRSARSNSIARSRAMPVTAPGEVRLMAARVLARVLGERQSLAGTLPPALSEIIPRNRGLLQELCYGTLRWYPQLQFLLDRLLERPLKPREHELRALLLLSLYQLLQLRVPDYAVVSEAVSAARRLSRSRTTGLVNAVLRNFQRRRTELLAEVAQDEALRCAHPSWLLERLQIDWPQDWPALVAANNARPPFTLRVNLARITRAAYLQRLAAAGLEAVPVSPTAAGVILTTPCDVASLPGFREGLVSVQDAAAQLAAGLLNLKPGLRVLDACAAPGGKTGHILESEPGLERVLALDIEAGRLSLVRENLERLGLTACLVAGDALQPEDWWDGVPFERILLDAPCSASGVIRRHPDIKLLREDADIGRLAERQRALLSALWPLLAPGGLLVYATCSVFKQENECVAANFIDSRADAREHPVAAAWGRPGLRGRQILPGEVNMDGFYYACLVKHRNEAYRAKHFFR